MQQNCDSGTVSTSSFEGTGRTISVKLRRYQTTISPQSCHLFSNRYAHILAGYDFKDSQQNTFHTTEAGEETNWWAEKYTRHPHSEGSISSSWHFSQMRNP